MKQIRSWRGLLMSAMLLFTCLSLTVQRSKPTIHLIGDSTVKAGQGNGNDGLWGWGSWLHDYLDTTKVAVANYALGGTSSRTFMTRGLWKAALDKMRSGDYLLMQFGHNDGGPLDDTARARGTLRGIGEETQDIYNPITKQRETVHTYGWYLSRYIEEARAKGVTPIICSPIPRNRWEAGRVSRGTNSYPQWAQAVAEREKCLFIPLHDLIADQYDRIGEAGTARFFFEHDHTHTNRAGARFNARVVAAALAKLSDKQLKSVVKRNARTGRPRVE